jgi:hypothetical protein
MLALVLALAACGDDELPTGPDPTTPLGPCGAAVCTTANFTGSVNQNGARTHNFATQASGTVTATLVSVGPDAPDLVVGLSLGTWNGSACQVVIAKDDAKQAAIVVGQVSALGSLCVRIYDVGNIPAAQPTDYEIQVIHP